MESSTHLCNASARTFSGVCNFRYLSQNIAFQELLTGNDEQITVTGQVSSSIRRRIVSFLSSYTVELH